MHGHLELTSQIIISPKFRCMVVPSKLPLAFPTQKLRTNLVRVTEAITISNIFIDSRCNSLTVIDLLTSLIARQGRRRERLDIFIMDDAD